MYQNEKHTVGRNDQRCALFLTALCMFAFHWRTLSRLTNADMAETHVYCVCEAPADLPDRTRWTKLTAISMTINQTTRNGKQTVEVRYYIFSKGLTARAEPKRFTVTGVSRINCIGSWT